MAVTFPSVVFGVIDGWTAFLCRLRRKKRVQGGYMAWRCITTGSTRFLVDLDEEVLVFTGTCH